MVMLYCNKCRGPHTHVQCGKDLYCHNCELKKIAEYFTEDPAEPIRLFQERYDTKVETTDVKPVLPISTVEIIKRHIGCNVICRIPDRKFTPFGELISVMYIKAEDKATQITFGVNYVGNIPIEYCRLVLTPIEKITKASIRILKREFNISGELSDFRISDYDGHVKFKITTSTGTADATASIPMEMLLMSMGYDLKVIPDAYVEQEE